MAQRKRKPRMAPPPAPTPPAPQLARLQAALPLALQVLQIMGGMLLVAAIVFSDAQIARHKFFWLDEGAEIETNCSVTPLTTGRSTGGYFPVYYSLQRVATDYWPRYDESIMVGYRLVSLAFVGVSMGTLFAVLYWQLGAAWAYLALATLAGQNIFHFYAAESRPYFAWLACFILALLAAAVAGGLDWQKLRKREYGLLLVACLLLTLVATPGVGQAATLLFTCGLCWRLLAPAPIPWTRALLLLAPPIALMIALWFYYAGGIATGRISSAGPDINNVVAELQQGETKLLVEVLRLLFAGPHPVPGLEITILNGSAPVLQALNLLMLAGVVAPVFWWRQRATLDRPTRFLFVLTICALGQILLSVPIAIGLAFSYYFVAKMFIYLIACYAVLVLAGAQLLLQFALRAYPHSRQLATGVARGALPALVVLLVARHVQLYNNAYWLKYDGFIKSVEISCSFWGDTTKFYKEAQTSPEVPFNMIVTIAEKMQRCPLPAADQRKALSYVTLSSSSELEAGLKLSDKPPANLPVMSYCGREVLISR
ncbi:MAG: hypothetical protein DWI62_03795 [Chloroflexi bacterium]|nr:MAG: hypothetical protein DWI62_03795 [Chloroflexota bacterium]